MIKLTSTITIGVLSLPLLASALPHPIVDNDSRDLLHARGFWQTVKKDAKKVGHDLNKAANSPVGRIAEKAALTALIARDPELYNELEARGFWNTVKNDAKKVGHGLSKAANSPVGQIAEKAALTALIARDPELYNELDARGFWNTVKNDAKKVGHGLSKAANSPVGQIAEKAALTALIARDPGLYNDLDARGFWNTVKNDAKKVGHDLSKAANSPVGQIAEKAALTALIARDPELYNEVDARGFWNIVKNDAKKIGQKVENAINSPVGQVVTQVGLTAAKIVKRDDGFDGIDARDLDFEERFFDEEFDDIYGREFEIDELD